MDMKVGRTQSKLDSVKDRGDLRKSNGKENSFTQYEIPKTVVRNVSDRGDTIQKNKIQTKFVTKLSYVINDQTSLVKTSDKEEDTKRDQKIKREHVNKAKDKTEKFDIQCRTFLDPKGRRRLLERYTLKSNKQKDLVKHEVNTEKDKGSDRDEKKSVGDYSKSNYSVKSVKSEKSKDTPKRRPIIKTITIKNNNKVYKAVTFVETKNYTPLQIEMPTNIKKKVSKATETSLKYQPPSEVVPSTPWIAVPSKVLVKERPVKKEKNRKRLVSPEVKSNHVSHSPTTEVAKWVPSSLNDHTKPYYEAWVNTKLAATSKCSEVEKEEVRRALKCQRLSSPELHYENFKDERYTGKIKIKTKMDAKQVENKDSKKPTSKGAN